MGDDLSDPAAKRPEGLVTVWVKGVDDEDIEVWRNGVLIEVCNGGVFWTVADEGSDQDAG
jgi:hypothetical protein